MRNTLIAICCIFLQLIANVEGNAQAIELKPAPLKIAIDGSLSEWGDQLLYSDKKNSFSYLISIDRDNLYLIVKTKDSVCQGNILGSGITLALSTNNPKISQKITFPLKGKEDPSEYMDLDDEQVAMKTTLARYKRIGVQNIKNVKAEQLSTANPYGIKVAVGYTEDGYMTYEEAIPLSLLYPDGIIEKCIYSIKINALARKIYYITHEEVVPMGKNKLDQLNYYIATKYHGYLEMGGPTPIADYEDKLTADTEVKGEFVIAK